ncbi:MAG: hypothetical protein JXR63_05665 [Spirochaetales bacterium]|nr:hypothetical protein [Spirochaetales bacterium]
MDNMNLEIEEWKQMLLKMSNPDFFEVMKNYFGEVKTPFNKHNLISDLINFLSKEETKEKIIKLIDTYDAKILSAIAILDDPDIETLHYFAANSSTYSAFSLRLINLEERLLIYKANSNNKSYIRLNPVLKQAITDEIVSSEFIFPSIQAIESDSTFPWLTDSLVLAFLSIIIKKPNLLKSDGSFRKKVEQDFLSLIPDLERDFCDSSAIDIIKQALINLNLVKIDGCELIVKIDELKKFSKISTEDLFLNVIAATLLPYCESKFREDTANITRKLTALFVIISSILKTFPNDRAYSRTICSKFINYSAREFTDLKFDTEMILEGLMQHSLLKKIDDRHYKKNSLIDLNQRPDYSQYKQIVAEANFEITLKPWAEFSRAIIIPLIADLKKFDTYPHYIITKESFFRTLNHGYSVRKIIKYLEDMNKTPIPQNISVTFENWESEFRQIRLMHGVVLKISPEKQYLVENTKKLDKWILEKLADGLYLFSLEDREEWSTALCELGISPLPKIEYFYNNINTKFNMSLISIYETKIPINLSHTENEDLILNKINKNIENDEANTKFKDIIDNLRVTKAQKDDMLARVEKKLVLFPEQITKNRTPGTVREATGLDYRGKLQQVKEALKNGNEILEITSIISTEGSISYLVHPIELRKDKTNYILEGFAYPFRDAFSMEVGKISKVRRLRTSLFAPK